jgi:hypothetical protein
MLTKFNILSAAAIVTALLNLAAAQSCPYGAETCQTGFVWRQAVPDDYVCVTPATRAETAEDNSLAASRVNPDGGAYGPNTCLDGYVWRQAVTADYVCVTPATRTQAAKDNNEAANRLLSLDVWLSTWTSYGGANLKVNGDHFNVGTVQIAVFDDDGTPVQGWMSYTSSVNAGYYGGSFGVQLEIGDCSGNQWSNNAWVQVMDVSSGCYSAKVPFVVCYGL